MPRVFVLGSINMDCVATVQKFPKPGETLMGQDLNYYPGGKGANQAVASARLGAETYMVGRLGNDAFAADLHGFLSDQNINLDYVGREAQTPTGTAFILVDTSGENEIIVIGGSNQTVSAEDSAALDFQFGDILVSQNEVPAAAIEAFFKRGKDAGAMTIYNPAPALDMPSSLFDLCDIVIVNESEADFYQAHLKSDQQILISTLGAKGVQVTGPDTDFTVPGHSVDVVDTTGAGDCFTGALAAHLSAGNDLKTAVSFANKAASIAVTRPGAGTGMPYLKDVA